MGNPPEIPLCGLCNNETTNGAGSVCTPCKREDQRAIREMATEVYPCRLCGNKTARRAGACCAPCVREAHELARLAQAAFSLTTATFDTSSVPTRHVPALKVESEEHPHTENEQWRARLDGVLKAAYALLDSFEDVACGCIVTPVCPICVLRARLQAYSGEG